MFFLFIIVTVGLLLFLDSIGISDPIKFTVLFVLVIIFLDITLRKEGKKRRKQMLTRHDSRLENKIVVSKAIELIAYENNIGFDYKNPTKFIVDEKNNVFGFEIYNTSNNKITYKLYKFSDLLNFNLFEDGEQSLQGRGLISGTGALLFGLTGAVVGSVAGNRKILNTCTELSVKILVNNLNEPILTINIIQNCKKDSQAYQNGKKLADEIIGVLTYIQNKKECTPSEE